MAKRGGKLTRAEKIQLSEEQRLAAGIDLSKPSHYAQKIASDNGVDDERLGDSFKVPIPKAESAGHNIGEHRKPLKACFGETDIHKFIRGAGASSTDNGENTHLNPSSMDHSQSSTNKPAKRVFKVKNGITINPNRHFHVKLAHLTTLSYRGVAHFDNLLNGQIQLPESAIPFDSQSSTFFSANRYEEQVTGHERPDLFADIRLDSEACKNLLMVLNKWAITRTIISDPDDPHSQAETRTVFASENISAREIYKALHKWSNGADIISPKLPVDARKDLNASLVVSFSAWEYYAAGNDFDTHWRPLQQTPKGSSSKHAKEIMSDRVLLQRDYNFFNSP